MRTFSELTSAESVHLLIEMKLAGSRLANTESTLGVYGQDTFSEVIDRIQDVYCATCAKLSVIPDDSTCKYWDAIYDAYDQFQTNSVEG